MKSLPSRSAHVLLIDDDQNVLRSLSLVLRMRGFALTTASSGEEALGHFRIDGTGERSQRCFDAAIMDLKMPGIGGQQMLRAFRARCPRLPVIILTGHGTVRKAVDAMRNGAFEFLVKPSSPEEILAVLERAVLSTRSGNHVRAAGSGALNVVGQSKPLRSLMDLVERVAALPVTVLIEGESGTGKELIARSIHSQSARSRGAFVAVNCASVTPELAEALFFGHRKGTFTGAEADRKGYFQAAHDGTLFLDEISDLPLAAQGVLLRALQEATILPVGATRPSKVDVRVISATNRDLRRECTEGRFRQDLFYRLNVIRLRVPPLRDRLDDLSLLIERFLEEYRVGFGFGPTGVSDDVMRLFVKHGWPGNVRELRNLIERAFAVCDGDMIEPRHLPDYLVKPVEQGPAFSTLEAIERKQIQAALAATNGEKKAAAQLLGMDRKRLYRRLKRLGL